MILPTYNSTSCTVCILENTKTYLTPPPPSLPNVPASPYTPYNSLTRADGDDFLAVGVLVDFASSLLRFAERFHAPGNLDGKTNGNEQSSMANVRQQQGVNWVLHRV